LLPPEGTVLSELNTIKLSSKVWDVVKALKKEIDDNNQKTATYFRPGISLVDVQVLFDQSKLSSRGCAAIAVADGSKFDCL
jgi:hypothetical protein